jgi:hypothetical protein
LPNCLCPLSAYAELITFLELTPWEGAPYREDKPDGNMRIMPFGKRAEGMVVYVVLEEQLRVVVVSVTWLELFDRPQVAGESGDG